MTYTLVHIESFTVAGRQVRTRNADESTPAAKIGPLWAQFFGDDALRNLPARVEASPIYGVYENYESDEHGLFDVTAGVKIAANADATAPSDLHSVTVEAGDYLVFPTSGEMPERIIKGWQAVWDYFKTDTPYQRRFTTDFEQYVCGDDIAIYIAVEPKAKT